MDEYEEREKSDDSPFGEIVDLLERLDSLLDRIIDNIIEENQGNIKSEEEEEDI